MTKKSDAQKWPPKIEALNKEINTFFTKGESLLGKLGHAKRNTAHSNAIEREIKKTEEYREELIATIKRLKEEHLDSTKAAVERKYQCDAIDTELTTVEAIKEFNFFGEIPKIPMDAVLLLAKYLQNPRQYDSICLPGRHYCKISDSVAGLLAWKRISGSEDGLHSRDDYFIKIVSILSGAKVIRNTTANSGSISGKRPDCCILIKKSRSCTL